MTSLRAGLLSADAIRSKVAGTLASAGEAVPPGSLAAAPADLVRSLPGWVGAFGLLQAGPAIYLWCEPRLGAGESFPSQLILDVPGGRYFVDAFDAGSGDRISRESAAGGPLVAGIPATGSAILVSIRPAFR